MTMDLGMLITISPCMHALLLLNNFIQLTYSVIQLVAIFGSDTASGYFWKYNFTMKPMSGGWSVGWA